MSRVEDRFSFRRLQQADLPMLHEWLSRPHLTLWWGLPLELPEFQAKYVCHISSDFVFGYIASLRGASIAYVQTYEASRVGDGWWPEASPGTWGIDQSLANEADLGRGLGTRLVREFSAFVFEQHDASMIITDPSPNNPRAIRCYEKAGFESAGDVVTPDGPARLMIKRRPGR